MKAGFQFLTFIAMVMPAGVLLAQPAISVNLVYPSLGALVGDKLEVVATVTSSNEIQNVQASIGGLTAVLVYTSSAYSNCGSGVCFPQPGWSNHLSLASLPWGNQTLEVIATDVFGNSGTNSRSLVHDNKPVVTVAFPADATVARPDVFVSASATDDGPAGTRIEVLQAGGPLLAVGTNSLSTNLVFNNSDAGIVSLMFRAIDSAGQVTTTYRQVYVQSSSNFVEVATVSDGHILDVQPDRILFQSIQNGSLPPDYTDSQTEFKLKVKSRADGSEALVVNQNYNAGPGFLTPRGGVLFLFGPGVFHGYCCASELYFWQAGVPTEISFHQDGMAVQAKGDFTAWGWGDGGGFSPQLQLTDLATTNTLLVTNVTTGGNLAFDLAPNGEVVYLPESGPDAHALYRYRAGISTLLTNDVAATNINSPKTDGTNAFYIRVASATQSLMMISTSGAAALVGGTSIGGDYLLNHGWITFTRNGNGQTQIWRRSPAGTNTQLTFYGTASTLAALGANGEVAFYNGSRVYISQGTWPPVDVAAATPGSGLRLFWDDDRWYATLGRSVFQISTGLPRIASPRVAPPDKFCLDLVAANGQRVVTQVSTNFVQWDDLATNTIEDGGVLKVTDPLMPAVSGRYYRLRTE